MEEALKLIVAKSAPAAPSALQCLQAIRAGSPLVQVRYQQTLQIALADAGATWTTEERATLASALSADEEAGNKVRMLRVRLTDAQRADLERLAREHAGGDVSAYVRGLIWPQ